MMINQNNTDSSPQPDSPYPDSLIDDLARALDAVDALIARVRPGQWSALTPCPDWNVRALVDHVIGLNRVFAALLAEHRPHAPLRISARPGRFGPAQAIDPHASSIERLVAFLSRPIGTAQ